MYKAKIKKKTCNKYAIIVALYILGNNVKTITTY